MANFFTNIKHLFFVIFFISKIGISQTNLVSNPGFENHTSCPTFMLQWDKCTGWLNCNGNVGNGLWGTPDYFHTCGTVLASYNPVPPNTGNGFCNPHTGAAMMGLVCYNTPYPNYREYISTHLSCPMTPGNTYTVSFWITASSAPTVKYNSSHFGVYLSGTYPVQSSYLVMNVAPQYEITTIINNTTWQQHTFTITPTTNLNFITLGCFRSESVISASLTTSSASQPYSNYFIDDISVIGLSSSGTFSLTSSVTNIACNGSSNGSATVTATGSGPYTYLWSPGNYTTASVSNLSSGIYTVTVNGGGCNVQTNTISISQSPVLTSTLTASSYTICKKNSVTLNSSVIGGTPSYTVNWNTGAISPSITITPSVTGIYNYTVTDANNCIKTQSVQINVESTLAGFINTTPSCNSLISFTNTSTNIATSFWNFGDGHSSSSNTVTSNTYTSSGIYTVSLISSTTNNCKDTIEHVVNVNANFLDLNFDYSVKTSECKDSLFFANNSQGAMAYIWNFGDGNTSTQMSPSHIYPSGVYYVTLIGSNFNCIDTLTKEIIINDSNSPNIENTPNVFTPNGDGANDIFDFKVMANCENFTFEIFDRWGLSIFKMTDGKQTYWDGRTTSGKEVTDGTYFYMMYIESGNKLKGTVTLFR